MTTTLISLQLGRLAVRSSSILANDMNPIDHSESERDPIEK
jgi:hypothetical protein